MSQHVRQGRGGKRERIACGGGTEKSDAEVGRRTKQIFFFVIWFPQYFLLLIRLGVKVLLSVIRERREKIRMGHHNGGMAERAKWRR